MVNAVDENGKTCHALEFGEIPDHIAKEFTVNEWGQGFVSRRGLARLCGINRQAIQQILSTIAQGKQSIPKRLKPFAGQAFEGGKQIPDVVASAIIKHYAYQGNETAQDTDAALGAVGL